MPHKKYSLTRFQYFLAIQRNCQGRLGGLIRRQGTFAEFLEIKEERKRHSYYAKLTMRDKARLSDMFGNFLEFLHMSGLLEWRVGTEDKSYLRTQGEPWTQKDSELAQAKLLFGGHFWKGSDKLFGDWRSLA